MAKNQLNVKNLGIAGGTVFGACMLLTTWANVATGYGSEFVSLMASVYPAYGATTGSILLGAIYGFIDGFIALALVAWIYNKLQS